MHVTRLRRGVTLGAIVATVLAFGVVLPFIADRGPTTNLLTTDTVVSTTYGQVVLPAGWDLDVSSGVEGRPVIRRDGVTVSVVDGVWFEDSAHLLRNVADLIFDAPVSLPPAPDDDGLLSGEGSTSEPVREVFAIRPDASAAGDQEVRVDVVRYGEFVVVVVARGFDAAVAEASDVIDAVVDSVAFTSDTAGVGSAPNPGQVK